jgi:two-component system sensor histidine kinase YesM
MSRQISKSCTTGVRPTDCGIKIQGDVFVKKIRPFTFLNYFSIPKKMMLIFIGCVILPLTIQNAFYYTDTEMNIQEEMMQHLNRALAEKTEKISGIISGTISLSQKYCMNEELNRFLDTKYSEDIDYLVAYQSIKNAQLIELANNQQVRSITLYTDNPTLFGSSIVKRLDPVDMVTLGENLFDNKFVPLTPTKNGPNLRISLTPPLLKISYDRSLSIVRPLKQLPQYSNYQKVLRIDIHTSNISSMLKESELFDNILLVDSDNRIIASANTYHEYGEYDIFSESSLKKGIVVLKQPLRDVPLSLYGLYNSKMFSEEFTRARWKTLSVAFSGMLLALLCILLVTSNFTKRTKLVVNQAKQIAKGNFIQIFKDNTGTDEIGVIADSVNQMSAQLKTLIEEKYHSRLLEAQLERETAQAKLLALQSQVNPHFMFNALECIRLKAAVKNETETAKMIMYMSRMFRHLINWEDDIIHLKDDMKFLSEFLNIQKYRFEDEFEYTVKVDEAAQDCMLPKLIIQPLVENACVHGVEAISHNRQVEICAGVEGDLLVLTVSDNGTGMSEERLQDLRGMLKDGKKLNESVGLYNVYQRLVSYYHKDFTFDIDSRQGHGTKMRITVPVRRTKEEFDVFNSSDRR